MQTTRIAIVGGGLSGLYAAYLLEQQGYKDYVVLEAREVLGGRIMSVLANNSRDIADRFDLGPSWFWPSVQPQLDKLVYSLELARFEQFWEGDMVVERSSNEPVIRRRGFDSLSSAMRLVGGMGTLIDALFRHVDPTRVITSQHVRHLRSTDTQIEIDSEDPSGQVTTWRADHVLLAMPPRLAEEKLEFTPPLPSDLAQQWRATSTWMAPHAKYFAIYGTPFWRDEGLSGQAHSFHGPLSEIHDASNPLGRAALFGFFGLPAQARRSVPEEALKVHCRAQLTRLFGPQAASPMLEFIKDWAADPFTATATDLGGSNPHAVAPDSTAAFGPWCNSLIGIGSEWSPQFPGYLAGAIEAASLGVRRLNEVIMRDGNTHGRPHHQRAMHEDNKQGCNDHMR